MIDERLLAILADGHFHSGQELGKLLGVSRSAVWKQMKALETLGVEVYSIRGRGYRIPTGLELLCEKQIVMGCEQATIDSLKTISVHQVADSTNLLAMRDVQQGIAAGGVYLAEYQTAGKGRRGRTWVSPFARNLYLSLVWRFTQGAAALEGLSLVVGLAMADAIEAVGIAGVKLKWPNDLLFESRKLAGILLEMQGDASGECQVVIGIGVNVDMPDEAESMIDQPWTDLKRLSGAPISRNQLVSAILDHLVPALEKFSTQGFQVFKTDWESRHAFQDQPVKLLLAGKEIHGDCLGVDSRGALIVKHEAGVEHFYAGEISVRVKHAS